MTVTRTSSAALKAREQIISMIQDGRLPPGERLPAEESFGMSLGVSRGTLRTVLSELQVEGVLKGSRHLGRTVAAKNGPPPQLFHNAMMLLSSWHNVAGASTQRGLDTAVDAAICVAAAADGRSILNLAIKQLAATDGNDFRSVGFSGVLFRFGNEAEAERLATWLRGHSVVCDAPVIHARTYGFDSVSSDHAQGSELLVKGLVARGCRRIQRLWSPASGWWLEQRNLGYQRACQAAGLAVLPEISAQGLPDRLCVSANEMELRTRAYAGWIGPLLCAANPPDGILSISDADVYPIAAACRLFGRTPGRDIWICGYDGYWDTCEERQFEPSLPFLSIDKRNADIGTAMYGMLCERLAGTLPSAPQQRVITPQLYEINA